MGFIYYNPNPDGKMVGDCVIRAVSKAMDLSWDETYIRIALEGFINKDMPSSNSIWGNYLSSQGFSRYGIPNSCPDCYTISDFSNDHSEGLYILATGSHVVTLINGNYYDAWDSGREIPVFYWTKEK